MRRWIQISALLLPALLAPVGQGAEPDPLAHLRAIYEAARTRLEAEHRGAAPALDYEAGLRNQQEALRKKGDLDGVLAVDAEIRRFTKERAVPKECPADMHPVIKETRSQYRKEVADIDAGRHRKIVDLVGKYIARLEALKTQLTQQDDIRNAVRAKAEIDRAKADPLYTAAQFALADLETRQTPRTDPAHPSNVAARPNASSVVTSRKKILPTGGFVRGWTQTALRIDQGDIVSVTAAGTWSCPGEPAGCGPEGYTDKLRYYAHYYQTQVPELPYGALLLRVGETGAVVPVGRGLCFTNQSPGTLYFDINVRADRPLRNSCGGAMDVTVEVKRRQ